MFYRVESVLCADTELRARVVLTEKNKLFTEVVRTLDFTIPIEKGRTIFKDEVNPMVEKALKDAGITVEGHEFG